MLHIGLDVGSTTVKIAVVNDKNEFIYKNYQRHYSDIKKTLAEVLLGGLEKVDDTEITAAVTGLMLMRDCGVTPSGSCVVMRSRTTRSRRERPMRY